jgi:hypothetical protein
MPETIVQRTKAERVKFRPGNKVYLRPRRFLMGANEWQVLHNWDEPFTVTEVSDHLGFPHYHLEDPHGGKWFASQLELSTSTFTGVR